MAETRSRKRETSKIPAPVSIARRIIREGVDIDDVIREVEAIRGNRAERAREQLRKLGYQEDAIERMIGRSESTEG